MKIPVNLASQPFRRDRAMFVGSIAVSVLLAATLGVLGWLIKVDRAQFADLRQDVSRINRQIREAAANQARMDAVLRRPENAEVLERSVFLNALLYRKGISWTRIFADLGRTVPYNVRVLQIRPRLTGNNQMVLDMNVAADSAEPIIGLLKALEESPLFGNAYEQSILPPTQAEPLYRYHLSVEYAQKL